MYWLNINGMLTRELKFLVCKTAAWINSICADCFSHENNMICHPHNENPTQKAMALLCSCCDYSVSGELTSTATRSSCTRRSFRQNGIKASLVTIWCFIESNNGTHECTTQVSSLTASFYQLSALKESGLPARVVQHELN